MTCERHIQISAKTLQKQSQKQALLKDNLIRQESSEFVWQHHNKNGLQKFNSICTQWRNERAPRKSKHVSTGATAAFPVSQYRQANRIYTINSCIIFYVCVFIMDLEHVSYVWESPFTVFWQTGRSFYNGKWGFRPLSQRAILGTQVWLWGSQTSRIPPACLFALSSDVIRVNNPNQCYWTFYMQRRRLLIIPRVNAINIICWSSI